MRTDQGRVRRPQRYRGLRLGVTRRSRAGRRRLRTFVVLPPTALRRTLQRAGGAARGGVRGGSAARRRRGPLAARLARGSWPVRFRCSARATRGGAVGARPVAGRQRRGGHLALGLAVAPAAPVVRRTRRGGTGAPAFVRRSRRRRGRCRCLVSAGVVARNWWRVLVGVAQRRKTPRWDRSSPRRVGEREPLKASDPGNRARVVPCSSRFGDGLVGGARVASVAALIEKQPEPIIFEIASARREEMG